MSNGNVLTVDSGPANTAQFSAVISLVNAAEQFMPAYNGAVSSLTALLGVLVAGQTPPTGTPGTGEQRVIGSIRIRFIGDGANGGGQTITVKLYKTPRGSTVATQVGDSITGIATTAGLHEAESRFAVAGPALFEPGDLMTASITPSGALTAVLTQVVISAGP